jgi:hypothetical protein
VLQPLGQKVDEQARLGRRRVVSSEGATHAHHLESAANLKPPRFGFALAGAAQNALMTGELIGVIGRPWRAK